MLQLYSFTKNIHNIFLVAIFIDYQRSRFSSFIREKKFFKKNFRGLKRICSRVDRRKFKRFRNMYWRFSSSFFFFFFHLKIQSNHGFVKIADSRKPFHSGEKGGTRRVQFVDSNKLPIDRKYSRSKEIYGRIQYASRFVWKPSTSPREEYRGHRFSSLFPTFSIKKLTQREHDPYQFFSLFIRSQINKRTSLWLIQIIFQLKYSSYHIVSIIVNLLIL